MLQTVYGAGEGATKVRTKTVTKTTNSGGFITFPADEYIIMVTDLNGYLSFSVGRDSSNSTSIIRKYINLNSNSTAFELLSANTAYNLRYYYISTNDLIEE